MASRKCSFSKFAKKKKTWEVEKRELVRIRAVRNNLLEASQVDLATTTQPQAINLKLTSRHASSIRPGTGDMLFVLMFFDTLFILFLRTCFSCFSR